MPGSEDQPPIGRFPNLGARTQGVPYDDQEEPPGPLRSGSEQRFGFEEGGPGGRATEWGGRGAAPGRHPAEGIFAEGVEEEDGMDHLVEEEGFSLERNGQHLEGPPRPSGRPPGAPGRGREQGKGLGPQPGGKVAPGRIALAALGSLPKASTLVFDAELRYLLAVGRAPGHHGLRPEEIEGRLAEEVLGPEWWAIYGPLYQAALEGESRSLEIWSNDGTRCYLAEVGPLFDEAQEVTGGVAVFRDVTKRKRSDEARHEAEERFELVFEQGPLGMALMTLEGRWLRVNEVLAEITGYSVDALMSKSLLELTYPDDRSNDIDELRGLVEGEIPDYKVEKRLFHARGHIISVVLWVAAVRDRAGRPQNLLLQVQDITERKLMEERLHTLAEHDPLTGLRNRRIFEQELGLQVDRIRRAGTKGRRSGESSALLIIDLDNFRAVNESAGHRAGDELLRAVAAALQERLRGTDLIARLDGDEFGVILRGTPLQAAEAVARGLREVVAECGVELGGRRLGCTASIGIAAIDPEVKSDEAVRIAAEQAMFQEKVGKRRAEEEGEGYEELPGAASYEE
jgi:diguanylate cyclase (GGDEF)-like protein/PAS domain S-box-containing protein